jgi:hypothetical protein
MKEEHMIHFRRLLSDAKQFLLMPPARYGSLLIALAALIILALPGSLMARDTGRTDQWQFMVEPYFWMASIDGSTKNGTDFSYDINDILDNLQFAIMGTVGVKKGNWSFLIDTVYVDVKDTKDTSVGVLGRTINTSAEVEVKSWVVTPVIGYSVIDCSKGKLDIVAGARYLDVQVDVNLNLDAAYRSFAPDRSGSDNIWDGIVGVKGEIALYEQLYMPLYLDIGTGNSDFTWQVAGGLGYRFGACDAVAGYRYLSWDFDSSSPINDLNLSGPYVGVKFVF